MGATQDTYENADRLALLLIARPREGWEQEFKELVRREVERVVFPTEHHGEDGE